MQEPSETLAEYFYNVANIPSSQVPFDCITDSWAALWLPEIDRRISSLRCAPQAEESTDQIFKDLFPFNHFTLCSQGRLAEYLLCRLFARNNQHVFQNILFPTTRYHQLSLRLRPVEIPSRHIFDADCPDIFAGNIDVEVLNREIQQRGADEVAFIYLEPANNSSGGYPVSMRNVRDVSELARQNQIPLILDTTRIIGNALMQQAHDPECSGKKILDIIRTFCSFADGMSLSLGKDFGIDKGGLLAFNDEKHHARVADQLLLIGTGLSLYDRSYMLRGLCDSDYYLSKASERFENVKYLHKQLRSSGLPLFSSPGYHCLLFNLHDYIDVDQYSLPGPSFLAWLYEQTGIRLGAHTTGLQREYARKEYIRLALPLGTPRQRVEVMAEKLVSALHALLHRESSVFSLRRETGKTGIAAMLKGRYLRE